MIDIPTAYPEQPYPRKPRMWGEKSNSKQREWKQNSVPQPWNCEVILLSTETLWYHNQMKTILENQRTKEKEVGPIEAENRNINLQPLQLMKILEHSWLQSWYLIVAQISACKDETNWTVPQQKLNLHSRKNLNVPPILLLLFFIYYAGSITMDGVKDSKTPPIMSFRKANTP